jgi:hypothetical protein
MTSSFATKIVARFAPFDFSNIASFPNTMPGAKEWVYDLPRFIENNDDSHA